MTQIILKANGVLAIEQQPPSLNIASDQCLIEVENVGICSSDIYRAFDGWAYSYPLIMGHEVSGIVNRVGKDVVNLSTGDRVAIFPLVPCFSCGQCKNNEYARCETYSYYGSRQDGGFCNKLAVNAWNLIKIPSQIKPIDACLIEPMAVVLHAIKYFKLDRQFNGNVIILGAGFLGSLAAQIIRYFAPKASIAISDRNQSKLKGLSEIATHAFQCNDEKDWECLVDEEHGKFNFVLETTGAPDRISSSIHLCSRGGEIVLLGNVTAEHTLSKTTISSILRKEIKITGSWNSNFKSTSDDWLHAVELMSSGFRPSNLVSHRIRMAEIPEYLKRMYDHKNRKTEFDFLKIVASND